jgi:uncharacterized protein DUF3800
MTCGRTIIVSRGEFPHDEGKHLVMALKWWAFGDESMSKKYCLVAGFVAPERQWKLIRREWRLALDAERIGEFHSVEFFQPASWDSGKSPYHRWKMPRAERFLNSLLDVVKRHPLVRPVGALVDLTDFFALHPDQRRMHTGAQTLWHWKAAPDTPERPVEVAARQYRTTGTESRAYPASFFQFVKEALAHTPDDAKLHIMLDENKLEEGLANVNHAEIKKRKEIEGSAKLGDLTFGSSADHAELQIADLYAYILVDWCTKEGNVGILLRQSADVLIGQRKRRIHFVDAEAFELSTRLIDKRVMDWLETSINEAVDSLDGG